MQNVYSLRIFAHASLTSSAGTVGPIVPSGFVYVLRDVDAFENTSSAGAFFDVKNPLGGNLVQFQTGSAPVTQYHAWRGRQVFSEGEQVGFLAVNGQWAIMASGYQLTLP